MKIELKIYILSESGEAVLGLGPVELLEKIDSMGSIRSAALSMNMSYSKAHGRIQRLENSLKQEILKSKIGGKKGGGSELTSYARNLIKEYRSLENRIKNKSAKEFEVFIRSINGQ
ncbi:MAG: LysR family transcriptional regulator [Elusimicrobia bacterium]|nr:LysR family transcriptional regulator [Elusimicrobiota bacterium]